MRVADIGARLDLEKTIKLYLFYLQKSLDATISLITCLYNNAHKPTTIGYYDTPIAD
jgi:hypothetical protein